jgi:predicted TIM-barrel fold metal-dependent hydrolase
MVERVKTPMIIDMHGHWLPGSVVGPAFDSFMSQFVCYMASRYGITEPAAEEVAAYFSRELPDPDGENMLRRMEESGLDVTVALFNESPTLDENALLEANKTLGKIGSRNPGKIIPFGGVNPTRDNAPQILRRIVEEFGIKGLKWHADIDYFWPNDERAYAMFEVAEELNIPIVTHTGNLPSHSKAKFSHPMLYDEVLVDFPNLKIIAAHAGYRWWRDWCSIAEWKPNFYGCLTEWQLMAVGRYEEFCRILRQMIDLAGVDRILFGTDSPGFDLLVPTQRWIEVLKGLPQNAPEGIEFTDEEVEAILGGNARRILGI